LKEFLNYRLNNSCLGAENYCIKNIEASDSKKSPEIQIVDIIMGAVGYKWEGYQTSTAKLELIEHIENLFGLQLEKETPYLTEKINIWKFKLKNKSAPLPTPR